MADLGPAELVSASIRHHSLIISSLCEIPKQVREDVAHYQKLQNSFKDCFKSLYLCHAQNRRIREVSLKTKGL